MDMDDRTVVMVMVNGIGSHLTNDEKRSHLMDIRREHLYRPRVHSRDIAD
jgi:hypothetical protein